MPHADQIISALGFSPLPDEGGYFKETYRTANATPASAIYYLITPDEFSALHRLKSDEIFHFYAGDPVEMIQIKSNGELERITLGSDVLAGERPQVIVPKGVWQGSRLRRGGAWALLGTTMTPAYSPSAFELADRAALTKTFPHHRQAIEDYTRVRP